MSLNNETTFFLLKLIVTLMANCIDKSSFFFLLETFGMVILLYQWVLIKWKNLINFHTAYNFFSVRNLFILLSNTSLLSVCLWTLTPHQQVIKLDWHFVFHCPSTPVIGMKPWILHTDYWSPYFADSSGSPSPVPGDQPGPLSRSVKLRVSRTCKACWFLAYLLVLWFCASPTNHAP